MGIWELLLLACGLAMDAFAVSVCKGLAMRKITAGAAATVGLWFGGFQALMPLIGYFLGSRFIQYIEAYDHWIAFSLLLLIGINMIRESFGKEDEEVPDADLSPTGMLLPAIATSIDALAVGVALAMVSGTGVSIWISVTVIGLVTFILSMAGVKVGSVFGSKFKDAAQRCGGVILILIGLKIVLEHLELISF